MGGVSTTEVDTYEDSYMKISYLVSSLGDGEYYFRNISKWLTMPFFRGKDIVSICTMSGTVDYDTEEGYYHYDYVYTTSILSEEKSGSKTVLLDEDDFTNVIEGNWYGVSAVLNLPNDISTDETYFLYYNYKVNISYHGYVEHKDLDTRFNTSASYSHSTLSFIPTGFSIGVSSSGASAAVEFTGLTLKDTRSAKLLIHYVP